MCSYFNFQEDDEGSYSCVAENVLGQTTNVAYLSVNNAQVNIIARAIYRILRSLSFARNLVRYFVPSCTVPLVLEHQYK